MTPSIPSQRLISLDALRGFTVAGMILVNVPGSWEHIYAPFRHADFNGLTLADLVFPFFLFIVGASIALALSKRIEKGDSKTHILKKVFSRSVIIFLLGIFLNWLSSDFSEWRIAGVLQRIGICYLLASLWYLYSGLRVQMVVGLVILLSYWVVCIFIPIPGEGVMFTPQMNWPAWVDSHLLPGKMYFGHWDPEGILSTLPAMVSAMTGMWAVALLSKANDPNQKIKILAFYGAILLLAGIMLSFSFPINKNVWSSSFVLVTSGIASLLWAAAIWLIDVKQLTSWAMPGMVFGANAISAYVLHYLLAYPLNRIPIAGASVQSHLMQCLGAFVQPTLASLIWALLYTALCFLPVFWMYRKKVFIKI